MHGETNMKLIKLIEWDWANYIGIKHGKTLTVIKMQNNPVKTQHCN
jgi:hypothetical protein